MANQPYYTYTLLGAAAGGERILLYDGTASKNITPTTLRTFMQAGLAAAPPSSAALLGTTAGGVFQGITLGTNLSLTGTTLNAAGGGTTPPASAPLLGSTSGSAFQAITLGTGLSITSNVLSAASGAAEGGTSTKVAIIPSASYPIGNEFGASLNSAITAVGAGGIVKVYPKVGGYTQTVPIVCTNGATVEGQGMVQVNFNVGSTSDAVTFGNSAVDDSIAFPAFSGFYFYGSAFTNCRDVFRVSKGIQLRVSRMLLSGAGRDGFHVEVAFDGDYIECCHFENIKTWATSRNSFHMETGTASTPTLSYINQTTFVNCNARYQVAGNSLKLVVGRTSDSHKISEVEWFNGELDSANSTAPDGVSMTVASGGIIENIHFQGVAIEDSNTGTHTGHAINTGGTGSATTTNCILAGFTGGGII